MLVLNNVSFYYKPSKYIIKALMLFVERMEAEKRH